MSIVKIQSYININNITEADALADAITRVNSLDSLNEEAFNDTDVVTKLYYITPILGRVMVVVNNTDKDTLGLDDGVLTNELIINYPLIRLPAQITEYREVIIKKGSTLTDTEIRDASQAVADNLTNEIIPYKVPIVKVVDYNNLANPPKLIMSSIWTTNLFKTADVAIIDAILVNNGDAIAGEIILNSYIGGNDIVIDLNNEIIVSPSNINIDDQFGKIIVSSGNKIVVGVSDRDDNGSNSGAVYIYDLDGTNEVKIIPSDNSAGDNFGSSVAINSNKIVVGAPNKQINGINGAGAVYIYDLDGTNELKITPSTSFLNSHFGTSVSINSTKISIGASSENNSTYIAEVETIVNAAAGAVYIYDLDGTNEVKILSSVPKDNMEFGSHIQMNNNNIYVMESATNSGFFECYIYNLDGTNEVILTNNNNNHFGGLSVSDTKIAISYSEDNIDNTGGAYIYDINGTNMSIISSSVLPVSSNYGKSVFITNSKLILGDANSSEIAVNSGSAYIMNIDGTDLKKILPSDGAASNFFGVSLVIATSKVIIGSTVNKFYTYG